MKDKNKTNVTFYIEKKPSKAVPIPTVFAVFKDLPELNKNTYMGYEHIGQHTTISLKYIKICRLATKEEYADLANELENIVGYNLNIK